MRSASFIANQGLATPGEQHISSLVVLHRHNAMAIIRDFVDRQAALEIAAQGDCRCVLLCETDNQRALMAHIDALEMLPGVINVSLIYHHVEPRSALDESVEPQVSPQGTEP